MENKEETFMQWLGESAHEVVGWLGGWLRHPSIPPAVESIGGIVFVGVFASIALASLLSPWWLLVTLPGGILLLLHGAWRDGLL